MESLNPYLEKCSFASELQARTKDGALEELAGLFVSAGVLPEARRAEVVNALRERESKMSTGMQLGIAIPHAKIASIDSLMVAIALSPDGIDFNSLDQKPSKIFIVTLSPIDEIGTHVRFLADISQKLSNDVVRAALMVSKSHSEMLATLCGE